MNLNQVTLPAKDMIDSCQFYRGMGFTQIVDSPHYARIECPKGDSTFSLELSENDSTNGAVIYFEHEQLDDWVDELVQKGFEFNQMPTGMNYLWREAILFDPSHNKIKLYWAGKNRLNPPWRVNIKD